MLPSRLLLYLLLIVFAMIIHRRSKKYGHYFRILLPSFRFFDRPVGVPQIRIELNQSESWDLEIFRPKRNPLYIFSNPQGNLRLCLYSYLEKICEDHPNTPLEDSPVYSSVVQIIKDSLPKGWKSFRFKIDQSFYGKVDPELSIVSQVIAAHD